MVFLKDGQDYFDKETKDKIRKEDEKRDKKQYKKNYGKRT